MYFEDPMQDCNTPIHDVVCTLSPLAAPHTHTHLAQNTTPKTPATMNTEHPVPPTVNTLDAQAPLLAQHPLPNAYSSMM